MSLIAAAYPNHESAAQAARVLAEAGLDERRVRVVRLEDTGQVRMPAQDEELEVSAEPAVSEGASESPGGAGKGAAIGGAIGLAAGLGATPFVGPAAAVGGAGVGAYTGSLIGALGGMKSREEELAGDGADVKPIEVLAQAVVEVDVEHAAQRRIVLDILNACGPTGVVEEPDGGMR